MYSLVLVLSYYQTTILETKKDYWIIYEQKSTFESWQPVFFPSVSILWWNLFLKLTRTAWHGFPCCVSMSESKCPIKTVFTWHFTSFRSIVSGVPGASKTRSNSRSPGGHSPASQQPAMTYANSLPTQLWPTFSLRCSNCSLIHCHWGASSFSSLACHVRSSLGASFSQNKSAPSHNHTSSGWVTPDSLLSLSKRRLTNKYFSPRVHTWVEIQQVLEKLHENQWHLWWVLVRRDNCRKRCVRHFWCSGMLPKCWWRARKKNSVTLRPPSPTRHLAHLTPNERSSLTGLSPWAPYDSKLSVLMFVQSDVIVCWTWVTWLFAGLIPWPQPCSYFFECVRCFCTSVFICFWLCAVLLNIHCMCV